MRKLVLSIMVILSLLINKAYSQGEYYDALKLAANCDSTYGSIRKNKVTGDILQKYIKRPLGSIDSLEIELEGNPFLKFKGGSESTLNLNSISKNTFGNVLGLNVTNAADGIAKFLVKRAKEELSVAFFKKFKEDMEKEKYSDLRILFPHTYKVLKNIDKDVYIFSVYINTLRESFIKDLSSTYENLDNVLEQDKYQKYFTENPEMYTVMKNSVYLVNQIAKGKHPGKSLEEYNAELNIKLNNKIVEANLRSGVNLVKGISESFKSKSQTNYWVPADSVEILLKDTISRNIFLGLLFQSKGNITFKVNGNDVRFDSILSKSKACEDSIMKIVRFITKIINDGKDIDEQISIIKSKTKTDRDFNDYYKFYDASVDLFEDVLMFLDLPYINLNAEVKGKIEIHANKWIYVARSTGELFVDTKTKNYSSAILNTITILDTLFSYQFSYQTKTLKLNTEKAEDEYKNALKNAVPKINEKDEEKLQQEINRLKENTSLSLNSFEKLCEDLKIKDEKIVNAGKEYIKSTWAQKIAKLNGEIREKILKYGTFMATIANAESSEDISNAIEAVALPVGSYSIKRNASFNVSVNGYLGYGYNCDNPIDKNPSQIRNNYKLNWSIYAPVGITMSTKFQQNCNWGSFSIFLPLLDVGGLANYRLLNDSTVIEQKITLNDILSPGLSVGYNIPSLPFTFTAGFIYKAPLAFDNKKGQLITIPGMWSTNLSVLVDIPAFNIFTKTKH